MKLYLDKHLEQLVHEAITLKISDIHFDIYASQKLRVEFRRHKRHIKALEFKDPSMYEQLKYIAGFNMTQGRLPQSGSFTYIFDREYAFRFSTIETPTRKYGVLRILNINPLASLTDCVQSDARAESIKKLMQFKNGLILFCGQTGSGKSTTMFQALLTQTHRKIFTLENPIEVYYDALIQMETGEQGLSIEAGITHLLRHDPDIIVLGEIRTHEELKQAIRCALSGHLVVSTIHSGSLLQMIHRLLDLDVSVYDLYYVLKGFIFQNLTIHPQGGVQIELEIAPQTTIQTHLSNQQTQKIP